MSKFEYPAPDCLIRDIESSLGQELFDIAVAEREPGIEPHGVTDDLRRELVTVRNGLPPLPYCILNRAVRRCRDDAAGRIDAVLAYAAALSGTHASLTSRNMRWSDRLSPEAFLAPASAWDFVKGRPA
jgi:hypothetical protein